MTGGWRKQRELKYESDSDRDPTGDELNAQWAVKRLNELAEEKTPKPFFMGVGFVRPHTPLIVPQKYFDRFPLDSIKLPEILKGDAEDTFKNTVTSQEDDRSGDRGTKMYDSLIASYQGDRELFEKVHSSLPRKRGFNRRLGGRSPEGADETGLPRIRSSSSPATTDGEMEKRIISARMPMAGKHPRAPHFKSPGFKGQTCDHPVSLVDLYPTLLDLCGLPADTMKNEKGRP